MNGIQRVIHRVGVAARWPLDLAGRARLAVERGIGVAKAWRQKVGSALGGALGSLHEFLLAVEPVLQGALEAVEQGLEAGEQTIRSAGYGFMLDDLSWRFRLHAGQLPARTAPATLARSMLAISRSDSFLFGLYELYSQSPTLRSHWPAMEQAIECHLGRRYYASVATLLPRVEGVLSDGQKLEGRIRVQDGERIVLIQGQPKLDKKGHPVKLPGMHGLARHADFRNEEALAEAMAMVAERMAPDRNLILHGHLRRYGTVSRSARALLLLWVLGLWVASLEGADLEHLHQHRFR